MATTMDASLKSSSASAKGSYSYVVLDDPKPKSIPVPDPFEVFITLAGTFLGISTFIFVFAFGMEKLSSPRKHKQRLNRTSTSFSRSLHQISTRKFPKRSYSIKKVMALLVVVSCCFLPSCAAANEHLDETQELTSTHNQHLNLFTTMNDEVVDVCHIKRRRRFKDIKVLESELSRHLERNPKDLMGICKDNCDEICAKYPSSKFAKTECTYCLEDPNTSSKSSKSNSSAMPSTSPSLYPTPTNIPCGGPCADDGDLCTNNFCDVVSNTCKAEPIQCGENEACDSFTGSCQNIQTVIPCVAVIDEWDNTDYSDEWKDFRTQYPKRPFCLLVPDISFQRLPDGFDDDTVNNPDGVDRTTVAFVNRDSENNALPSDWFDICDLGRYANAIDFIGIFIDESGSMTLNTVRESAKLFAKTLRCAGISADFVFNGDERWIDPFFTSLKPPEGTTDCGIHNDLCGPEQSCVQPPDQPHGDGFCEGPISIGEECTPTSMPSSAPSLHPSQAPSEQPSVSVSPSFHPSQSPSIMPSS